MTIPELIEQARLAGIKVYLKAGEVKLAGKKEPDPGLVALLRKNKGAIQRFLSGQGGQNRKAEGTSDRLRARRQWERDPSVRQVMRVLGGKLASFSGLPEEEGRQGELIG